MSGRGCRRDLQHEARSVGGGAQQDWRQTGVQPGQDRQDGDPFMLRYFVHSVATAFVHLMISLINH